MPPIEISQTSSGSSASTPVNVKLLLIGNASVGKSSLLLRFSDEAWIPEDEATATIGVDFRVSAHHWTWGRVQLVFRVRARSLATHDDRSTRWK